MEKFVANLLHDNGIQDEFLNALKKRYDVIVFGSVVRDVTFFPEKYSPRDIDFIVDGPGSMDVLETMLKEVFLPEKIHKNRFDGIKVRLSHLNIDIWKLEDTLAFKNGLLRVSQGNIIKSVFLNIDEYAYNLNDKRYINHCDENEFPKMVDICLLEPTTIDLNVVRALVNGEKYGIPLSGALLHLLYQQLKSEAGLYRLMKAQMSHYGKQIVDLRRMSEEGSYDKYML